MKIEDFADIQYTGTGTRRIRAYHVNRPEVLEAYFKACDYKPSVLAGRLNIHYQSLRKLLQENELWRYVQTQNGKARGHNRKRKQPTTRDGYPYSENLNAYKFRNGRSRRVLKHVEVTETRLGRELTQDEVVHHVDGDKLNNAPENLHVCSRSEHGHFHGSLEREAFKLVKSGLIKFHPDHGYYLDNKVGVYETDKG